MVNLLEANQFACVELPPLRTGHAVYLVKGRKVESPGHTGPPAPAPLGR
jgi:hypothetical protein